MIWWRGNGLWLGLLVCLPAISAGALGPSMVAAAYASSAVLIFVLRDTIGAESALYSIPTRFWPPILLVLALVIQFSPGRAGQAAAKTSPQAAIANLQGSLPRMLNKQIRMDKADFDIASNTLQISGMALVSLDSDGAQQAALKKDLRKLYCENSKALVLAKVGVELTFSIPPRTLSDRVERQTLSLQSKDC